MLGEEENFAGLGRLSRALIGKAETMDSGCRTVLDMDSTEIPDPGLPVGCELLDLQQHDSPRDGQSRGINDCP